MKRIWDWWCRLFADPLVGIPLIGVILIGATLLIATADGYWSRLHAPRIAAPTCPAEMELVSVARTCVCVETRP